MADKNLRLTLLLTAVDKMSNVVSAATNRANTAMGQMQAKAQKRAAAAREQMFDSGMAAAAGAAALAYPLKMAANYERLRVSMIALTGSNQEGTRTYNELIRLAADTPLQLSEVAKVTTMMIGYGSSAKEATDSVKMLGDITALTNGQLDNAIVAYGQARQEGKMMTRDLRQLINAGVPIVSILQDILGAQADVFQMAEDGEITFTLLQKALEQSTDAGGRFENGLGKLASTGEGLWVRLTDEVARFAAVFGESLLPTLKIFGEWLIPHLRSMADWFKSHQFITKAVMGLVAVFTVVTATAFAFATAQFLLNTAIVAGTSAKTLDILKFIFWNKAVRVSLLSLKLLTLGVWQSIKGFWVMSTAIVTTLVPSLGSATTAWAALNAMMLANPIGVVIVAITALVAYVGIAIYKWKEFGASMMLLMGPVGWIVNAFMSIREHWSRITEAFGQNGLLAGIKAVGNAMWDSILYPMQQLMGFISKLTGFEWAKNFEASLKTTRVTNDLIATTQTISTQNNPNQTASSGISGQVSPVSGVQGGQVAINYNPTVNLGSGATEQERESFLSQLAVHKDEIARMVQEQMRQQQRRSFA